jgi:threonine aldolase
MRAAAASAELGDDGYGEDPTVHKLEHLASFMLGKQSACFMPSGTMANIAALKAHHSEGRNIVLLGDRSDLYAYESEGGKLCFLNTEYRPLPTQPDGTLRISDLERELKKHEARVAAITIENPHNLCGGIVLPDSYCKEVSDLAHSFGVKLHLDGARIFNAAVASRTPASELGSCADSVQFCLSKGLAAPVGSMVVGDSDFIERVRNIRKWLGGTMRQAGIIAAPGIVALENMVERLAEDHENARRLAEGLARIAGICIDLNTVQTNMVVFSIMDERFSCESFIDEAMKQGVRLGEFKFSRIRAVVHYGITKADIAETIERLAKILKVDAIAPALAATRK